MYLVYENNKLARYPESNVDPSWTFPNEGFKTFEEASKYLNHWMGYLVGWGEYPINFTPEHPRAVFYETVFEIKEVK